VKTPIVAASVIYFGSLTNVESVVIEGYKWYGLSLERQRRQLQLSSHRNTPPTVEEICMPIMLSFFEVICSTSPTAYFQHIIGAAKLLEGRGPEACKSGTFHQLFKTVRVQMVSHPLKYANAYMYGWCLANMNLEPLDLPLRHDSRGVHFCYIIHLVVSYVLYS
jgi:hypothetical protein